MFGPETFYKLNNNIMVNQTKHDLEQSKGVEEKITIATPKDTKSKKSDKRAGKGQQHPSKRNKKMKVNDNKNKRGFLGK